MASKLDQPLDDMIKSRRQSARRSARGASRASTGGRVRSLAPPVGGVSKPSKSTKQIKSKSTRPVVPTAGSGESKIIVTGLPPDVSEQQIKEYFAKTIGPVKKVFLTYGPNGQSRGVSTIVFSKPESATEAAAQLNGVKVDNRAMKIEVVVGADQAPVPIPAKALSERIVQSKATTKTQPKSAVVANTPTNGTGGRGRGRARRGGRSATRSKPKTAEELDAEMTDYFDTGANLTGTVDTTVVNGEAQPTVNTTSTSVTAEDEIMTFVK